MSEILEIFKRAITNPFSYVTILRFHTLYFKEHRAEGDTTHSFIFTGKSLPMWKAGQHGLFFLPGDGFWSEAWRVFSLASTPHEGHIMIGTKIPELHSDFKERLLNLKPGDKIFMFGPIGEFHVSKKVKNIVAVAGGIGITPLRSLILDLAKKHSLINVTLIYSSADDSYTYKDELEKAIKKHRQIKIIYVKTPEEVNLHLNEQVKKYSNSAHYFISGPAGMVASLRKSLKKKGIKHIVNDPFRG